MSLYSPDNDVMHLSAAIPGGVTPGTYAGIARDLSTLFVDFKPGMGGLDCFCTFVAGSPGENPRECSTATILQMELETSAVPFFERTRFQQNGDRKDGKRLSYFSCILSFLAGHPSLT